MNNRFNRHQPDRSRAESTPYKGVREGPIDAQQLEAMRKEKPALHQFNLPDRAIDEKLVAAMVDRYLNDQQSKLISNHHQFKNVMSKEIFIEHMDTTARALSLAVRYLVENAAKDGRELSAQDAFRAVITRSREILEKTGDVPSFGPDAQLTEAAALRVVKGVEFLGQHNIVGPLRNLMVTAEMGWTLIECSQDLTNRAATLAHHFGGELNDRLEQFRSTAYKLLEGILPMELLQHRSKGGVLIEKGGQRAVDGGEELRVWNTRPVKDNVGILIDHSKVKAS